MQIEKYLKPKDINDLLKSFDNVEHLLNFSNNLV